LPGRILIIILNVKAAFQPGPPGKVVMRGTIRGAILRMLLAFFAGAIAMLFVLTPGKVRYRDLFSANERNNMADFDQAADRVEKGHEVALYYARKAKRYAKEQLN